MRAVRTIEEIRHARLLQLLEHPDFPTIQALADKIERSHAQVSQWKNKSERRSKGVVTGVSNIDSASARWIESKVGKATGWMDNDPVFDNQAVHVNGPRGQDEPATPNFHAKDVTASEWDLLNDLRVLPDEELALLRERVAKNREHIERVIAARRAGAHQDQRATPAPAAGKAEK
jgi:hypothetical protein